MHRWRARSCAVLTGSGTALADDPQLDVRAVACTRQPLRILVDSRLRVPRTARLFSGLPIVVAHVCEHVEPEPIGNPGSAVYWRLPDEHGHVALKPLLHRLAEIGINELLVEAGPVLSGALIRQSLVDEVLIYTAPILLGAAAQGMLDLGRLIGLGEGPRLDVVDVRFIGQDLRIQAYPRSRSM